MGKEIHICENCNKEFEDYCKTTRFCSRTCYEEYRQKNRKTKVVICPICGIEFLQSRPEQIYCGNECKAKSTENKVDCICEHCGKSFKRIKSEVDKNTRHYCSNECRHNGMFWSKEDTDILINNYKKMSYKEMSDSNIFSVHKTVDEISRRAGYIGITESKDWSDDEFDILINNYSKVPMDKLMEMLPKRTKPSILGKARVNNLKSNFYLTHMYSKEEDDYLKNNYLSKSNKELGEALNRTPLGISQHLLVLDLHRPTDINNYGDLNKYVRGRLTPWIDKVKKSCNYTCALTGTRSNIIVHHIRGFNLIFYETIELLNFPIFDELSKYSQEQLDEFVNTFLEIQENYKSYICINDEVHKKFHKEYGYGDNNEEQWNEFVNKYYNK